MRCCQHVRELAERVIGWERLLVENVDGRLAKFAFSQGVNESGLIDDWPARRIHKARRPLHEAKLGRSDKTTRPAAEHQVNADDVGFLQKNLLVGQNRRSPSRPPRAPRGSSAGAPP